tara:strand:- start:209 stop:1681 length:1473 start_codon:yes stop_codon:yes gene_type:complete
MENLDLDIDNYNIKDLETFFRLPKKDVHTFNEIESKESKIRSQLLNSGHINKRSKRDLIDFLEKAKKRLVDAKCKLDNKHIPTTIPSNYKLDDINTPISRIPDERAENVLKRPNRDFIYNQSSDFLPGNLNPLNTRIITKCLNIDTRYRSNILNTNSSDLTLQLPTRLSKVVSMELASIELPPYFYSVCDSYGNNFFHITVNYVNLFNPECINTKNRTIIIPDGNYTEDDLITIINFTLQQPTENGGTGIEGIYLDQKGILRNEKGNIIDKEGNILDGETGEIIESKHYTLDEKGYIIGENNNDPFNVYSFVEFKLDLNEDGSGSHRVSIGPRTNNCLVIKEIILDFSKNIKGDFDNKSLFTKLGWNLGFTKGLYSGSDFYYTERMIEQGTKYIFLSVEDFNNSSNSNFINVFNDSIMNNDILARISIKGKRFHLLTNNDFDIVSEPKTYFGPVDIQRLRVRLLDEHGRILKMDNTNYSFCLKLKMLYDL